MQALLPGLLVSLASMATGGLTWIFATKATRDMGPLKSMFLFQLIGVPLFIFLFPFAPHVQHVNYLAIGLIGMSETFALLLLFYALQVGEAAVVLPTTDFYALISAILGIVFLHESLYLFKIIGMIAIFVGVILIGFKLNELRKSKSVKVYKGILPALLMAVGTGVYFYFVTISSRESGWLATALGIRIAISLTCYVLLLFRGQTGNMWRGVTWRFLIPAALCDVVSFSLYSLAVSFAELSYVTIIYSTQSVLTVILAYFFLKETLNKYQIAGLIIVVVGLIFLQLH